MLLVVIVASVSYLGALFCQSRNYLVRRASAILSITGILSILIFFKYGNFIFLESGQAGLYSGDIPGFMTDIVLPIGISFYVFQAISYVVDVYREETPAETNYFRLLLYIVMFPQLIAGPIVRFTEVRQSLIQREHSLAGFALGMQRFFHGLFKKVVIADTVALVAQQAFLDPSQISASEAWLGLMCYTIQIYFDFSGYSDMAIGLGMMLGIRFPENFNRPYSAATVTDFWRRWHMTLSRFFRDYVYFPLGGNRRGALITYRNLALVFALTGFWHGASWVFLIWGLYHGGLLIFERIFGLRTEPQGLAKVIRRLATLLLVMLGWVLFYSTDIGTAMAYFYSLADFSNLAIGNKMFPLLTREFWIIFTLGCASLLLPGHFVTGKYLQEAGAGTGMRLVTTTVYSFTVMLLSVLYLSINNFSPFLYFQF